MLQEIRVRFSPSADNRFRVQLTDAAGTPQGVEGHFTPFLTEDDYENLRWYLEDYMDLPDGGAVIRAGGIYEGGPLNETVSCDHREGSAQLLCLFS